MQYSRLTHPSSHARNNTIWRIPSPGRHWAHSIYFEQHFSDPQRFRRTQRYLRLWCWATATVGGPLQACSHFPLSMAYSNTMFLLCSQSGFDCLFSVGSSSSCKSTSQNTRKLSGMCLFCYSRMNFFRKSELYLLMPTFLKSFLCPRLLDSSPGLCVAVQYSDVSFDVQFARDRVWKNKKHVSTRSHRVESDFYLDQYVPFIIGATRQIDCREHPSSDYFLSFPKPRLVSQ